MWGRSASADLALHDVVHGAGADRLDGYALAPVARHDHDRRHRAGRLAAEEVQPLAVGEQPVGDHQVGRRRPVERHPRGVHGLGHGHHEVPGPPLEGAARQLGVARLVLDEQDAERLCGHRTGPPVPNRERPRLVAGTSRLAAPAARGHKYHRFNGIRSGSAHGTTSRPPWHVRCRSVDRASRADPPGRHPRARPAVRRVPAHLRGGRDQSPPLRARVPHPGPTRHERRAPDVLFEYVRRKRAEAAVDRACVATALADAAHLPAEPRLSLNVHASTLGRDTGFRAFLLEARPRGTDRARTASSSRSSSTPRPSTCPASGARSPTCARPGSRSPSTTWASASRTTR